MLERTKEKKKIEAEHVGVCGQKHEAGSVREAWKQIGLGSNGH